MKWIGNYIQDLFSIFRNRVLIERHEHGVPNSEATSAALKVDLQQTKDLGAGEVYTGTGLLVDVRDSSTSMNPGGISFINGANIKVTDEDVDGIKIAKGLDVEINGSEQAFGVYIDMNQGTATSVGNLQPLYIHGCGNGEANNSDIRLISKNNTGYGATIDAGDDGHLTIKTYQAFSGDIGAVSTLGAHITLSARGEIYLSSRDQTWNASPNGCYTPITAKILPNEFMVNDDAADAGGGATNAFVTFDDDLSTMGAKISDTNSEMFAFFKIPEGRKVTFVKVNGSASTTNACRVYSYNYVTGQRSAGTNYEFDINEVYNITDISHGETNDMILEVAPASSSDIIYGATLVLENA
tara:strand:- start:575 stop:1636 length:1062 start_codon:yes stop_codon:yes gene_type:complete